MPNKAADYPDFASVKERLDQIVQAVSDDNLPLDDALDLYEEAVALGMRASDLLEEGIEVDEDELLAQAQAAAIDDPAAAAPQDAAQPEPGQGQAI